MAKVKIEWCRPDDSECDLQDYGYDCSWNKLTTEQQNEIIDDFRDEIVLMVRRTSEIEEE